MQTCWKCGTERALDAEAPEWQCPACGVAYNKDPAKLRHLPSVVQTVDMGADSPSPSRLAAGAAWVRQNLLIFLTIIMAGGAIAWGGWLISPWSERSQAIELAESGMRAVESMLIDPESARWRDVRIVVKERRGGTQRAACGEVNAKNKFGGYAGYSRFIATPNGGARLEDESSEFEGFYRLFCSD